VGALNNLPPELVAGWALWLVGGVALMLWFRRRSRAPQRPVTASGVHGIPPTSAMRLSGTKHAAPRNPGVRTPDAFAELKSLLDPQDPANR